MRLLLSTLGLLVLVCAGARADDPGTDGESQEQTVQNSAAPCLEPPPVLRWQDYHGPYEKLVGVFARKLERKSARAPHYKPGAVLCSLEARDKFMLFVDDTFDPISFLSAGFNAGMDQASGRDPAFGQGAGGYAKRFGADFASQSTWRFFTDFAYPIVFSEDPRYYRLGQGTTGKRLFHAMEHTVIAHRDDGSHMFNFSLWLGTGSALAMSDVYHPGNAGGIAAGARAAGYSMAGSMGFDILREFWPEVARKLHLPFRDMREPAAKGTEPKTEP